MRVSTRLLIVAALGLIGGGLGALLVFPAAREHLMPKLVENLRTAGKAQVGGPFALTDHTGQRVTDKDFQGRHLLVYFGFTFCPDVCPTGLQVIAAALDQLGAKADRITPVFITLDPARDTPAQLAGYVGAFHPRLIGLTGTQQEIEEVARAYRVYFKSVKDDKSAAGYTLDHTSIIYLMDSKGEFVVHFTHATAVDAIVSRLQRVL